MTIVVKKVELVFSPGCFDTFEGTQEELDSLMVEIQASFDSGEFLEKAIGLEDLEDAEISGIIDTLTAADEVRILQ